MKLSGLGLASLLAPPLNFDLEDPFTSQQGRVVTRTLWMHAEPSAESTKVRLCQRDTLVNITNTAVGADETAPNRIWYQCGTEGYVYSGSIQPVRTILSAPRMDIPKEGLLAEISVPYTDALEAPDPASDVAYRMYYETTHWVMSVTTGTDGQVWYQVLDDKWDKLYYAPASHIRIITPEEISPLSPDVPAREKRIVVKLDSQITIAYEGDHPVFVVPVATGAKLRSGNYTTPQGNFITFYKRPARHMAAGDLAASGFDLPGVPWVQYITKGGISFHGTFWHNEYGRPRSHGCINLSISAAKWLFRWTSPDVPLNKIFSYGYVGTKVEISA